MPLVKNTTARGLRGKHSAKCRSPFVGPGVTRSVTADELATFKGVDGVVEVQPELSPRKKVEAASAAALAAAKKPSKSSGGEG